MILLLDFVRAPQVLAQQPDAALLSGTDTSIVQKSSVYIGEAVDGANAAAITDELVEDVTQQKDVAAAWRSLVRPGDHVGIKISAAGGRNFSTHQAIVDAVLRGLASAGIPTSQVVVWDRTPPQEAGYAEWDGGPSLRSVEAFTGYNPKAPVQVGIVGKLIWGDLDFHPHGNNPIAPIERNQYSDMSHWSRLISGLTKIINIPVMETSEDCGVAGCLYNVTVPNLDNWRRLVAEPACGDPYLAQLYADPHAGPKVVMNIMDGIVAQYGGGPDWQPRYSWNYGVIFASKDPVAIDATALRLMELWRKQARLPSLSERARYLQTAESLGLGSYDPLDINLAKAQR